MIIVVPSVWEGIGVSQGDSTAAAAEAPDVDAKPEKPWWRRLSVIMPVVTVLVLGIWGNLLVVSFVVAVAFMFFMAGFAALKQARVIADTPTSTIRGAPQGRVELNVRLPEAKPLTAPLIEEDCCFWQMIVETVPTKDGGSNGRIIGRAWSGGDWMELEDGTGRCLVYVREAQIHSMATHSVVLRGQGLEGLGKHFPAHERAQLHAPIRKKITVQWYPVGATLHAIGLFHTVPSNRTPFDEDWAVRLERQGAAAPAYARKMAQMVIDATAEERAKVQEDWRARMRKLEGIGPEDTLGGTVMVHTLRHDDRRNRTFQLRISDQDEAGIIASLRRQAFVSWGTSLFVLAFAGLLLYLMRPDLFNALVEMVR